MGLAERFGDAGRLAEADIDRLDNASSRRSYVRVYRDLLTWLADGADRPVALAELDAGLAGRYDTALTARGLSPASRRVALVLTRRLCEQAGATPDPALRVPSQAPTPLEVLSEDDYTAVRDAAAGSRGGTREVLIVRLLGEVGLRPSELLALRTGATIAGLPEGRLLVPGTAPRTVTLPDGVAGAIVAWLGVHPSLGGWSPDGPASVGQAPPAGHRPRAGLGARNGGERPQRSGSPPGDHPLLLGPALAGGGWGTRPLRIWSFEKLTAELAERTGLPAKLVTARGLRALALSRLLALPAPELTARLGGPPPRSLARYRQAYARTGPAALRPAAVWTPDALLGALRAWAERTGTAPRHPEWDAAGEEIPAAEIVRCFGRWKTALERAGLDALPSAALEREQLGRSVQRLHGEGLSLATIGDHLRLRPSTTRTYAHAPRCPGCGQLNLSARERGACADCVPANRPAFTPEEIVGRLHAWAARTGEAPRVHDWLERPHRGHAAHPLWLADRAAWPSSTQVIAAFGSMSAARRAACLPDPPRRPARVPRSLVS